VLQFIEEVHDKRRVLAGGAPAVLIGERDHNGAFAIGEDVEILEGADDGGGRRG
jgi:hypothetical protein